MKVSKWILFLFSGAAIFQASAAPVDRPNILWILSEDNSQHFLKWFDPDGAPAPAIESLAAHGLTFDHAFSCSPVCSVARTTLMSGVYAPKIGTQFHRNIRPVALPEGWQLWPAYLREAGYFTSNQSKTDYNTAGNEGVWDESSRSASWRNRPAGAPFFHMQTFGQSHESSLHFTAEQMTNQPTATAPESVRLADYHPDTETFRYTYARYHDRMGLIDREVGRLVNRLEEDGLLEDTFIFYFGDHGGVLPGSKGYLRETGLHVPLVVRIPKNWEHLVDAKPGNRVTGFVSFVDFGPTVLNLAGVALPSHLDGKPFLGEGIRLRSVNRRHEAFSYADRFDEKYEMVRAVRVGPYKYVRYFQGHYPDALQNNYRYRMLAYQEWRNLYRAGELNPAQSAFFEPKPPEALYQVEEDPYEVNNLATDPAHLDRLKTMRRRLDRWMADLPDLSLFPESYLVDQAMSDPLSFGRRNRTTIRRLLDLANLQRLPFPLARTEIESALASDLRWDRYWGLVVCTSFGEAASDLVDPATRLLSDVDPMVQIQAAEFLGRLGVANPSRTLMQVLQTTGSPTVTLHALNTVVYLNDHTPYYKVSVPADSVFAVNQEVERRLEYLKGTGQ